MPARRPEAAARARKAAELYLEGEVDMRDCCERYGVSWSAAWRFVKLMRAAARAAP